MQKSLTIDRFNGMSDKGCYFIQSMKPVFVGGKVLLEQFGYITKSKQKGDSNLANLDVIEGWTVKLEDSTWMLYGIDKGCRVYKGGVLLSLSNLAEQHHSSDDDVSYPDIAKDLNGNIIYVTRRYLAHLVGTAWTDTWKDLGAGAQFTGQEAQSGWRRQIDIWEDMHLIGNGNYLAVYTGDGTDFSATYKQLPYFYQFSCMAHNSAQLLVGANKDEKGVLLLWNGWQSGWQNRIDFSNKINSIKPYGAGWMVQVGTKILYTNGYSYKEIATLPDTETDWAFGVAPNGMLILENNIILLPEADLLNRRKGGTWIYDLSTESWNYIPYQQDSNSSGIYSCFGGAIFFESWLNKIFLGYGTSANYSNPYFVGILNLTPASNSVFILPLINFGTKVQIDKITLSIINNLKSYENYSDSSCKITLSLCENKDVIWKYAQPSAVSTDKSQIKINGTISGINQAEVGDEVWILEGKNAGNRRFITNIAGKDTATEVWTLDSDLPDLTEATITMNVLPFRKYGMEPKTLTGNQTEKLEFYPSDFLSEQCFLQIEVEQTNFPIQVEKIVISITTSD